MSAVRAWAVKRRDGAIRVRYVAESEAGCWLKWSRENFASEREEFECVEVEVREPSSPEQDAGLLKSARDTLREYCQPIEEGDDVDCVIKAIDAALSRREAGKSS